MNTILRARSHRGQSTPRIEQQQTQSLAGMLRDLPCACDTGTKLDSKGDKSSWNGYKLHIDTGDGDGAFDVRHHRHHQ